MPRRAPRSRQSKAADRVLEAPDETLLDLLDHMLATGVMATGDVTLGVAGIDLIYLRLSTLLCAADRVLPPDRRETKRRHLSSAPRLGVGRTLAAGSSSRRTAVREGGLS